MAQCPNCGGFRTEETGTTLLDETYSPIDSSAKMARLVVALVLSIVVLLPFGYGAAMSVGLALIYPDRNAWLLVVGLVLAGVGFFLLMKIWSWGLHDIKPVSTSVYHYVCYLCGNRWVYGPGIPKPVIHDRPDLRELGERRLREQEAAFEDARAHYFAEEALKRAGYRR